MNSKKKDEEKNRKEIQKELPSFINQMLLLLSSGLVLQQVFQRIATDYGSMEKDRENYFTKSFHTIYENSKKTGESFITVFYEFSKGARVKELSRLAGILADSRDKGTLLWDKLAKEGEEMWAQRKQSILKEIKLAESKMSFPLGMLLLSLIIITAAPAMLQMYID